MSRVVCSQFCWSVFEETEEAPVLECPHCAAERPGDGWPPLPHSHRGYRLLGPLVSEDPDVAIFRATRERDERDVALKLPVARPGQAAANAARRARLLDEIDHHRSLQDTPYVAELIDAASGETPYLATALVSQPTLADHLDSAGGRLAPDDLAEIGLQLSRALQAVHRHHLVHNAIRPATLYAWHADDGWRIQLADLARACPAQTAAWPRPPAGAARPEWGPGLDYASPELIRGEAVDDRSDVYAAAATLWRCATGAPPYASESQADRTIQDRLERALRPPVPPPAMSRDLFELLAPALAFASADRPPAGELLQRLRLFRQRQRERQRARRSKLVAQVATLRSGIDRLTDEARRLQQRLDWWAGLAAELGKEIQIQLHRDHLDTVERRLAAAPAELGVAPGEGLKSIVRSALAEETETGAGGLTWPTESALDATESASPRTSGHRAVPSQPPDAIVRPTHSTLPSYRAYQFQTTSWLPDVVDLSAVDLGLESIRGAPLLVALVPQIAPWPHAYSSRAVATPDLEHLAVLTGRRLLLWRRTPPSERERDWRLRLRCLVDTPASLAMAPAANQLVVVYAGQPEAGVLRVDLDDARVVRRALPSSLGQGTLRPILCPNGRYLLLRDARTTHLIELGSERDRVIPTPWAESVSIAAFSKDSRRLAVVETEATTVWDIGDDALEQVQRVDAHPLALAFHPEGRILTWLSRQPVPGDLVHLDLETGALRPGPSMKGEELWYGADGRRIFTNRQYVDADGLEPVTDLDAQATMLIPLEPYGWLSHLPIRPRRRRVASWRVHTLSEEGPPGRLAAGTAQVTAAVLDQRAGIVYSSWTDGRIRTFAQTTGKLVGRPLRTPRIVWQMALSPDGCVLGCMSKERAGHSRDTWSAQSPAVRDVGALRVELLGTPDLHYITECALFGGSGHFGFLDNRMLVALSRNGDAVLWRDPGPQDKPRWSILELGGASRLAVDAASRRLVAATAEHLRVWQFDPHGEGRELARLPQSGKLDALALAPGGAWAATARASEITLYHLGRDNLVHRPVPQRARTLVYGPAGVEPTLIALGDGGGRVGLLDIQSGRYRPVIDLGDPVRQLAFTADGAWLTIAAGASLVVTDLSGRIGWRAEFGDEDGVVVQSCGRFESYGRPSTLVARTESGALVDTEMEVLGERRGRLASLPLEVSLRQVVPGFETLSPNRRQALREIVVKHWAACPELRGGLGHPTPEFTRMALRAAGQAVGGESDEA